jgi:hypothetical protein
MCKGVYWIGITVPKSLTKNIIARYVRESKNITNQGGNLIINLIK